VTTVDVSVVIVTFNSGRWIERCLESVRGYDTIVVDHGSTDETLEIVRRRFSDVHVIEEENLGMGGGNNAGMRLASGRYFLLLNSDAWVTGDAVEQLARFVGPRLLNPDGSLQRSVRAFPTLWRLATEYLFLRKLAPRSRALNSFYEGGFNHDEVREVDWVFGACLLVRRDAADEVGLFDESFFMFSEETDWCYRFHEAGWRVFFFPGAEVVHVGGASHGGSLFAENVRGHLRFLVKHRGTREAERGRRLLLAGVRLRLLLFRGERRRSYREAARWLSSGKAGSLLRSR